MMDLARQMDRAEDLLKKAGAGAWEIMALFSETSTVGVREGQVDKFQTAQSLGLAIRVQQEGRLGFSFLLGGEEPDAARSVELALAAAKASDPEEGFSFAGAPGRLPEMDLFDPAIPSDPVEAKVERALALAKAAKEADPRVVHVQPAEFASSVGRLMLRTSAGAELSHEGTSVSAGAAAMASENGQQEMGWEGESKRFLADLDPVAVGREAGLKAAAYLGAGPVPDGRYDVVLTNDVAADFLDLLAQSLLGDNLVKGRSLLANLLGKQALGELITIIDDGLMPRGLGSQPFDDEGTPQSAKELVAGGMVQSFVFDRLWAARAGRASTGNAVRAGLKAPPGVGFSNLYLKPGQGDQASLAAGLGKGLVISEIMGGHTADPVSGEFSFGAAGHLVEDGKVTRAVKSIAIAGQVVELFKKVAAVGGDLRFFGRTGAPSLLVEGLSVSG